MRSPIFTQAMQIGIVVRDLDATIRKHVDESGTGPWKTLHELDEPVARFWRVAVLMVGQMQAL